MTIARCDALERGRQILWYTFDLMMPLMRINCTESNFKKNDVAWWLEETKFEVGKKRKMVKSFVFKNESLYSSRCDFFGLAWSILNPICKKKQLKCLLLKTAISKMSNFIAAGAQFWPKTAYLLGKNLPVASDARGIIIEAKYVGNFQHQKKSLCRAPGSPIEKTIRGVRGLIRVCQASSMVSDSYYGS